MIKISNRVLGLAILMSSNFSFANLKNRYEVEVYRQSNPQTQSAHLPKKIVTALSGKSFLLIDGMFGDLAEKIYEKDFVPFLKSELHTNDVYVVRPASNNSMDQNARYLAAEIKLMSYRFQKQNTLKPLIVIAHSRGAAEMLVTLMLYPELIHLAHIEQVILVEGAFNGSPIADWAVNILKPKCLKPTMIPVLKETCDFYNDLDSLQTMIPYRAIELRQSLERSLGQETRNLLQSKVSFVRGQSDFKSTWLPLVPSQIYLSQFYGPNDGVLLTEDQYVPGLGLDLGILNVDHLRLLKSSKKRPLQHIIVLRSVISELVALQRIR